MIKRRKKRKQESRRSWKYFSSLRYQLDLRQYSLWSDILQSVVQDVIPRHLSFEITHLQRSLVEGDTSCDRFELCLVTTGVNLHPSWIDVSTFFRIVCWSIQLSMIYTIIYDLYLRYYRLSLLSMVIIPMLVTVLINFHLIINFSQLPKFCIGFIIDYFLRISINFY